MNPVQRFALTVFILFLITAPVLAQSSILEQNVRAQLNFLASDAMQGRGSGTNYERIAAEYIGSQFRQFGLEPGGDADSAGNKGFVQRVSLQSSKFVAAPTLTITSGANTQKLEYGREFLVSFLRSPRLTGELQVVEPNGTFTKGAVVAYKLPDGASQDQRRDIAMKAFSAGSAAVVMVESDANKRSREAGDARLPSIPPQRSGGNSESFGIINLRKDVFDALLAMPSGTKLEFGGATESSETTSTWNVIGVLRGSDQGAANDVIILSAHLDHLGVSESLQGDKIFNGADDDASGCVAVLELARVFASGRRPRRTIYFICFGSEETGGYGARYARPI